MKLRLTILALFFTLACQKEPTVTQMSTQTISDLTLVPVTPTPQLLSKDANFIAYANMSITIINRMMNKNFPELMGDDIITNSQYQAVVKRMGFVDTSDYKQFMMNMKFKAALLKRTYGAEIPSSVISGALDILRKESYTDPGICSEKYNSCVGDIEIYFNSAMWVCFTAGLTGSATTTPIGGGLLMIGCGLVVSRNVQVMRNKCSSNWRICLKEYVYPDEDPMIINKMKIPDSLFLKLLPA